MPKPTACLTGTHLWPSSWSSLTTHPDSFVNGIFDDCCFLSCWALEYARGWIPLMMPFGLADTLTSTLDFPTLVHTFAVYGKCVVNELLQGKFWKEKKWYTWPSHTASLFIHSFFHHWWWWVLYSIMQGLVENRWRNAKTCKNIVGNTS